MQQLSPMDAAFLYLENESTNAHGTFVWIYDASDCEPSAVSRGALLEHMAGRVGVSPIFTRKVYRLPLDFDYPYWVDDEGFELLYHVRELSMPDNGEWRDFCELVGQTHSRPLDRDHPLWELTLVTGLTGLEGLPVNCFAILGKFHHVAIDGATGMHIIEQIHDGSSPSHEQIEKSVPPARAPGLRESLFRAAVRNIGALDKSLELLGAKPTPDFGAEDDTPPAPEVTPEPRSPSNEPPGIPQTLFNRAVSGNSTWDARSYDLNSIKAMRQAVKGATVNDVLLTIVAGGLREYLESQGELPDSPMKAGCPVNIRTDEEAGAGGNVISAMVVNMHTDVAQPLKRLAAITRSSGAAKARASERGSRKVLDIMSVVPAQAQAALGHAVGAVARKLGRAAVFNCSVSNLPGPQQELTMLGGRLVNIGAAMPVMNGFGLFIGLTTCAGKLTISLSSCDGVTSDIDVLGDCMDTSFNELNAAASAKAKRARRPRKTA
mgnify:CR=1 FL=1